MNEARMKKVLPKPEDVSAKAGAMPWKGVSRVSIAPYADAIVKLRERHYSFGEIAAWMTKQLNTPVQRGQVYHIWRISSAARKFVAAEKKMREKVKVVVRELDRAAAREKRAGNAKGVDVIRKLRRMTIKGANDLNPGPLLLLAGRKAR